MGAAIPGIATAAVVTLENGDQITGKVTQLSNGVLAFKADLFGDIKIPWGKVGKLVTDDAIRVQLSSGDVMEGSLALDEDGQAAVAGKDQTDTTKVGRRDIAALNPPINDGATTYAGKIDLGGGANRGNSDDDQLHMNGELTARSADDRYRFNWEINEARSGGVKTTSNRRLLAQRDVFVNDRDYLFVNGKAERDELAGLNLRTALGGGIGRQFIESGIARLSGEIGLSYVNEDYDTSPDRRFPALTLGFKYEKKFFDQKLVYFNNLNVDTNLEDTQDILLHNRMGFRLPIADGINLSTQFNIDFDNDPADGKQKTDSALIFSLGYAF
jgi:putative salt-induced outer membrane protein YdiY